MTEQRLPPRPRFRLLVPFGLMTFALSVGQSSAPAAPPDPKNPEAGIEVQARGPVHEAFAQPSDLKPDVSPAIGKAPPSPIPEEPPAMKPDADKVQWIGGYWSWDADRKDFVWVSGTWRVPPTDREWVPGYWANTPEGWRWVPGYWGGAGKSEVPIVPVPPASLDNGPAIPAPGANYAYTPGVWVFRTGKWLWRPGYWNPLQPSRVWVCAHYLWTPAGYIFVDGYWDYPLENRGLLFAPVCFNQPYWLTPGWIYRPSFVVGINPLLAAFWVRPAHYHYYYGDWYGPRYAGLGFRPWHTYGPARHDPLYSHYRFANRGTPGWETGLRTTYLARSAGTAPLPPRTLAAQSVLLAKQTGGSSALQVVTPLSQVKTAGSFRMTSVTKTQITQQVAANQKMQQLVQVRRKTETAQAAKVSGTGKTTITGGSPKLNTPSGSVGKLPVGDPKIKTGPEKIPAGTEKRTFDKPKNEGKTPPGKSVPKGQPLDNRKSAVGSQPSGKTLSSAASREKINNMPSAKPYSPPTTKARPNVAKASSSRAPTPSYSSGSSYRPPAYRPSAGSGGSRPSAHSTGGRSSGGGGRGGGGRGSGHRR
jgi:hypothetical protein